LLQLDVDGVVLLRPFGQWLPEGIVTQPELGFDLLEAVQRLCLFGHKLAFALGK